VVFTGGWDGILRAVDASGKVIWSFDAKQDFQTVNGVIANGGSFGPAGAVIVNGMVYVASGYVGIQQGSQGNVVLAFGVE
jgi:polyvinyl alcohol dehydrogenase (cytochrome)